MLYRQDGSFCDPAQTSKTCNQCFRRYTFWGNIPYRRAVFAALTSNVKAFISPSQALIDLHIKAGYAPNRFRLIPYGIPAEVTSSPYHVGVRKFVASSHNYHNLVFAGGGVEIKGAHVLIQAIPLMMRHIENLRIAIAGGGERKYLSQFHQYGPTIHRLGPVPFNEMRTLFAAADLTLVPSVWFENSPVVIYENFHVGTPVVGSAFGGIPELIHERETGYLCSVGDPVTLAEKVILHFARSAQERRQMRHHCVETVRTDFSMNRHIEGTLRHYHEILSQ
jgi:glycosyltransferase involved in cell wall biosynthesis